MNPKTIRILLADDHQIVRQGLRRLLETESDFQVVAEAADGRIALDLVQEHHPDVVVMDVSMPHLNGIDATRRICAVSNAPKVVALSMHCDRRFMSEMFQAGAVGYLPKDTAAEELILAVRAAAAGKVYLSPEIANVMVDDYISRLPTQAPADPGVFVALTPREREVLQLMAEGLATKQIAAALHVSIKTVETHRRQIMEKLDLHSVAELTKYAIREGLTTIEM